MVASLLLGLVAGAITYVIGLAIERYIHRLTRNPDRSYRWGVWLLAALVGGYVIFEQLGRG